MSRSWSISFVFFVEVWGAWWGIRGRVKYRGGIYIYIHIYIYNVRQCEIGSPYNSEL
jgi:hypothetical protein